MGKKRNWKARTNAQTIIDNSEVQKIELDDSLRTGNCSYDESNLFVLPSQKRKTKIKKENGQPTKILSKKHRKRLEKIIEKKEKKSKRSSLLEALSKVHAAPEELTNLTSIASIQTKGLRRFYREEADPEKVKSKDDLDILSGKVQLNSIRGAKRTNPQNNHKFKSEDPNVVGFESSSSGESDDDSEQDEDPATKKLKLYEGIEKADDEIVENDDHLAGNKDDKDAAYNPEDSNNNSSNDISIIEEKHTVIEVENEHVNMQQNKRKNTNNNGTIKDRKPAVFVDVIRSEKIQEARMKLPILAEEQQIMETINENRIIIIAGETGSGKTTQVPQFLYEAGHAINKQIAITEPRRVAAIAMSKRVAKEMNLSPREVSYLIRFEGNVTDDTKIKFMTDGVLLKEVQKDFLLSKYSVVILDEAHERSVYTDILIGLLSRIVPLRQKKNDPLKLIIMSATLRLEDFTSNRRLFKISPPVIKVDARQYPVTIHFNKRTDENYLLEAFNKVAKIHMKLPEGGILAFVTGQQEVNSLVRKLRKAFSSQDKFKSQSGNAGNGVNSNESGEDSENDSKVSKALRKAIKKVKVIPEINLDDYSVPGDDEDVISGNESDLFEDDEVIVMPNSQPLWVLPLYSLLPSEKQAQVFRPPPEGYRLCIISTNVAETSLTIPNIKYVVDTGKTKVKLYDKVTGVSSYVVTWTSKASAEQRAGRAGRLGPGHCYRLYSSAVFNDTFQDFSVPEIQQKPVDDLYLQLKCMYIDKVMNFPFPTAPDLLQLKAADYRLTSLGAIKDNKVTPLGKAIVKYPVLPRFGKMLALSNQHDLMPYTICLVATLSVQEVLLEVPISPINPEERKNMRQKWAAIRLRWARKDNCLLLGDNMVMLAAIGGAEWANTNGQLEKFCEENGLRHKAVVEIRKLRLQLTNLTKANVPGCDITVNPRLQPPSDLQAKLLRQILLAGMGDQVAKKFDPEEVDPIDRAKFKYAYHANNMEEAVFLHQGSVLAKKLPEFLVYNELYETNKIYMRGITAIDPEWLVKYVPTLCNMGQPLMDPEPRYEESDGKIYCMVSGTFGKQAWSLPKTEIEHPKNIECYKWFARFLLEGKVFSKLAQFADELLSRPNIMVKSWAKLQARTVGILKALAARETCTRDTLAKVWSESPQFLLKEYLDWIPESQHGSVTLMWPPI